MGRGRVLRRAVVCASLASLGAFAPLAAVAATFSFAGVFADPNDVFLQEVTLSEPGSLLVQTFGYGGSGNAAGGTNGAGQVIEALGFDPYVSVFAGTGPGATFLASNDDGVCGPGAGAVAEGECFDSTLDLMLLPAGGYTLALTSPFNFSFAENLGTGTLGDGFIGLASDFGRNTAQPGLYAVDITTGVAGPPDPEPVPAPGTVTLLVVGVTALGLRRSRSVSSA